MNPKQVLGDLVIFQWMIIQLEVVIGGGEMPTFTKGCMSLVIYQKSYV